MSVDANRSRLPRSRERGLYAAAGGGSATGAAPGELSLLRAGPLHRRLRIATGGVLLAYVATHLLNHALGNVSVAAMEAILLVQKWIWQGVIGTILLYGSLVTHAILGIATLYLRRYVGWTRPEIVQLVLGLCIPLLLANHITVTRLSLTLYGLDKGYAQELTALGIVSPFFGAVQILVLIAAWGHACIGLQFAFRLRRWYVKARMALLLVAVLVPVLALLGFAQGVREVRRSYPDPAWRAVNLQSSITGSPAQNRVLAEMRNGFILGFLGLLTLVVAARRVRAWQETRLKGLAIAYPDGRVARLPPGLSVLDASRMIGFRHASVCGGRGRCSTCRIWVCPTGGGDLPPPSTAELYVLQRIGADSAQLRVACQLRPTLDVRVVPLVPTGMAAEYIGRIGPPMGEERFVVAMFVDMRGSTRLAQNQLAYDAVFLVRRFVELAAGAVVAAGGIPNQFTGDGIMALFGLRSEPRQACNQALDAALAFAGEVHKLNTALRGELAEPIGFGIGLHCGRAIVGEIGFHEHTTFTALGDVANVAARLETATRRLACQAVVSDEVMRLAGAEWPVHRQACIEIAGGNAPIAVHLLDLDAALMDGRIRGGSSAAP